MKTRQAHASIILLNYTDRGGSAGLSPAKVVTTTEPILLDKDIISISTTKQKSAPAGRFEFSLAPTKNWIAHITPGSWVIIHMAPRKITQDDINSSNQETLKMIGRIDSVRVSVQVDPSTGARSTLYRVQGRDWGQVFESSMYIDPAAFAASDSPFVITNGLMSDLLIDTNANKKEGQGTFSTTNLVDFVIKVFAGQGLEERRKVVAGLPGANQFLPQYVYKVPDFLKKYMNMSRDGSLTNSIEIVAGKLTGYDKYTDEKETIGIPLYPLFIGNNMLWQLINEHSCSVINENIAELRWIDGKPKFCLYKRVKPFIIDSPGAGSLSNARAGVEALSKGGSSSKIQSSFFNVKRTSIDLMDVITLEMGNNWQDSANFVEIMPDASLISLPSDTSPLVKSLPALKGQSNVASEVSWARDGFRPLMYSTKFFPTDSQGTIDIFGQTKWLPTMAKWYFDTHKMLNGTVTMIGQDKYIGVGDNIMLPAATAGSTNYVTKQENPDSNILGHIEAITNTFTVQSNGARSFITTVNFIRGIIVNNTGNAVVDPQSYGIDTFSSSMSEADKKHTNVTGDE